jgi:hypothetical protein
VLIDKRAHRRHRLIRAVADGGNAIEIARSLLAEGTKATQGVEQQNDDREEPDGMSQRKENNARDDSERSQPRGPTRLARDLVQGLAVPHRILVMGRGPAGKFDGFGNLTKALTFFPQRAAGVAECRVSEHAGLIHAFDAGHDPGPQ